MSGTAQTGADPEGVRYDVFVSYRWTEPDQSWVRQSLIPALKHAGLRVCLDVEDFVPGRDLILEMNRAGSESRRALCILSPDYFEGKRLVGFESLMLRRLDPTGADSRLIPFLLRATSLPEWIRGLVPIDWTDLAGQVREWRKLLKVLGASNPEAEAPPPVIPLNSAAKEDGTATFQPQVSIVKLLKLEPREGAGIGYEVVLRNDSYDDVFVDSTEVSGTVAIVYRGAAAAMYRVGYEILLDSVMVDSIQPGVSALEGTAYDASSQDWGIRCQGKFQYEMNTSRGRKSWEYAFSMPTVLRIPANDRVILRVLFRMNSKKKVDEVSHGQTPGAYQGGIIQDSHVFAVKLEHGQVISAETDDAFLKFIANWKD